MQITYTLTRQDYTHLHTRMLKQSMNVPFLRWIILIFIPGMMLFLAVVSPFSHGDWRRILVTAVGLTLGWFGLTFGISRIFGAQAYLKRPGATAMQTINLLSEGVLSEVQGMRTRVPWAAVTEITADGHYFAFSTGSPEALTRVTAFFIPLRAFASPADAQAFFVAAQSLRSSATAETSASWMALDHDSRHDLSVSYSLTLGELGWMGMQVKQSGFFRPFVLGPVIGVLAFAVMWFQLGHFGLSLVVPIIIVSGTFGIMFPMMRLVFQRGPQTTGFSARPMGDYRMTLTPLGFEQRSPSGLNWYPWPVMTQITQKSDYVLFWTGRSPICIVPPSAFSSAEEAQAFLTTAQDYHQCAQNGTPAPLPTRPTAWPPPPMR